MSRQFPGATCMFELPGVRKEDKTLATEKDKMSGTTAGEETSPDVASEPALSSVDEVVDKKGYTTSIIWRWFGYLKSDEGRIRPSVNTSVGQCQHEWETQLIYFNI